MNRPRSTELRPLFKHVVVFSVSIGKCVGSGVALRRAGTTGRSSCARCAWEGNWHTTFAAMLSFFGLKRTHFEQIFFFRTRWGGILKPTF